MSFRGSGECLALMTDFPEPGLFPVRCQLVLHGLPAPFVGGLLTTNTITSSARFGGEYGPTRIHTSVDRHDPVVEGEITNEPEETRHERASNY